MFEEIFLEADIWTIHIVEHDTIEFHVRYARHHYLEENMYYQSHVTRGKKRATTIMYASINMVFQSD